MKLDQPVPTAYYTSTHLSKLPDHETLNFSKKPEMNFFIEIDSDIKLKVAGDMETGWAVG